MSHRIRLSLSVSLATLAAAATAASAQQPVQLPAIVIEGATLAKPPVLQPKPKPAPTSTADNDATDAPPPKPKASASSAGPLAAPSTAVASDSASSPTAGIPAAQIGSAVTVVTASDIQAQQARTSADVLRALPGVTVTPTGSVGSVTQVRIRGNDGRDTRVLIDGVEVNTTKDAEYDFSNLSPDDIERIEVIRGPMSALYGSGALGGVVNIETKAARGPLSLSVRSEMGSFGTKDLAARLAAGNDSGYFAITGQSRDTRGFVVAPGGSVKEATHLETYGLRAGLTLSPSAKLDMTLRYTDKHAGFPDFGVDYVTPSAIKPYLTADDARNTLIERSMLAGVRLTWDALDGALTQQIKTNYTSDVSGNRFESVPQTAFDTVFINNSRDAGTRANAAYLATYRLPTLPEFGKHSVTGLIERQRETFTPFSDYATTYGNYNGDGVTRTRDTQTFAGEWNGLFWNRLALSAGVRRDDVAQFQTFDTWRTSASLDWKEWALRPHASAGTGVKLPGMYDQYGANSSQYESNPNLRPEHSRGYDIGVEKQLLGGRLLADVTYFASDLRDRITLSGFDAGTFKLFPENAIGLSTRRGVETSVRYQVTPQLFLGAAYTYTEARQPDGTPEFRRVPHGGRIDARYLFDDGKGTISIAAIGNSRTPDVAFLNDGSFARAAVHLDGYWLVQLAASYKVQPNVEIYGRIENALNAHYQEVYGYNTAGIGAYAGVKVKFDDLLGTSKK